MTGPVVHRASEALAADAGGNPVMRATAAWLESYPSRRTRDEYRKDVRAFIEWCEERGHEAVHADRGVIAAWVRWMDERHAASSVARRLAAVRSWFEALVVAGVLPASPVVGIKLRPVGKEGKTACPTVEAVRIVREAARADGETAELIAELCILEGFRFAELVTIRVEGCTVLPSGGVRIERRKKGGADASRVVDGRAAELLARSCTVRASGSVFGFPAREDLALAACRAVWRRVNRAAVAAGGTKVLPHQMRVWGATTAQDQGCDTADVRAFGGWSSDALVQRYDRNPERRVNEVRAALRGALEAGDVHG